MREHAKLLCTEKGVSTQRELAARVGVREQTISKWIKNGKWNKWKKTQFSCNTSRSE
ncbi:MAG: helix-turn-helix transcriptional regulator [Flavobacteriales bacterium]